MWVYKHGYARRTRPVGVLLKGALHHHSRTVERTPGHPGQPSHYPEATLLDASMRVMPQGELVLNSVHVSKAIKVELYGVLTVCTTPFRLQF